MRGQEDGGRQVLSLGLLEEAPPGPIAAFRSRLINDFPDESTAPFWQYLTQLVSHWFDQCDLNRFDLTRSRTLSKWLDDPTRRGFLDV